MYVSNTKMGIIFRNQTSNQSVPPDISRTSSSIFVLPTRSRKFAASAINYHQVSVCYKYGVWCFQQEQHTQ